MTTRLADVYLGLALAALAVWLLPWWCALGFIFLAAILVRRFAAPGR